MKLKELKKIIDRLAEKNPDNEVVLVVSDYFTTNKFMTADFLFDADVMNSCKWIGIRTHQHETQLSVSLSPHKDLITGQVKQPKITFRKMDQTEEDNQ